MTDEVASRTVVSLATVREVAGARLRVLSIQWDAAKGDPLRTARIEAAADELVRICMDLGAGTAWRREDGSVGWD